MNYSELKELAEKVDRVEGEERKRLVEKLIEELPKLDPLEGHSEYAVRLAERLAIRKWLKFEEHS